MDTESAGQTEEWVPEALKETGETVSGPRAREDEWAPDDEAVTAPAGEDEEGPAGEPEPATEQDEDASGEGPGETDAGEGEGEVEAGTPADRPDRPDPAAGQGPDQETRRRLTRLEASVERQDGVLAQLEQMLERQAAGLEDLGRTQAETVGRLGEEAAAGRESMAKELETAIAAAMEQTAAGDERLVGLDRRLRELEQRWEELKGSVATESGATTERLAELGRRIEELERRPAAGPVPAGATVEPIAGRPSVFPSKEQIASAPPLPEGTDLNSATFEQLRERGLSPTQAARFLGARQAKGGFRSAEEIDELPGFTGELRDRLKRELLDAGD